ncbi:MAG: glycosyltransferase, partial [Anaerolineae bacterium]|nr:glycosyltransferase [Anaerolineae bacterium]
MKVMMIVARLNIGGVALNVLQTVDALQKNGVEVVLVHGRISQHEGDMQYLAENLGIQSMVLPALERDLSLFHDLKTLWQLYRLMRKHRPDVVHTHTAKAGFVGRWAAWLARIPVRVHTFHGHVFHGYFSPRKTHFFLWMERLTARISSKIITLSESLRTELSSEYQIAPSEKIEVIPLGLKLQPFKHLEKGIFRRAWSLPPDVPIIAVVGRLVPIKNHLLFLQAARWV